MRTICIRVVMLMCFASMAGNAHAETPTGCSMVRSAIGAVIGGVLGTLVFPGLGTGVGVALGGGGTCGYDSVIRHIASAGVAPTTEGPLQPAFASQTGS
jgi:hypothetical protein